MDFLCAANEAHRGEAVAPAITALEAATEKVNKLTAAKSGIDTIKTKPADLDSGGAVMVSNPLVVAAINQDKAAYATAKQSVTEAEAKAMLTAKLKANGIADADISKYIAVITNATPVTAPAAPVTPPPAASPAGPPAPVTPPPAPAP